MRNVLAVFAATAALMCAGTAQAAMYIVTDANGQKFVVDDKDARTPLLLGTAEAPPDNCQAGFFYQAGNNRVLSCGDQADVYDMAPVAPGTMMANGNPYPAGSMSDEPGSDQGHRHE